MPWESETDILARLTLSPELLQVDLLLRDMVALPEATSWNDSFFSLDISKDLKTSR
jgi:hypothetical protein